MLILMTVSLWLSVFLLRLNFINAIECEEMTIRYEPFELSRLDNCTTILGSLTIMSLGDLSTIDAINKYNFPQLKEITGYLMLFNVIGLKSCRQLFPNLSVIRGQQLVQSYSLIIFSLPHLTEVGFKSLISIQRGYVFIERCPALCYHNTVDWEALTDEDEEDLGAGKGNVIQDAPSSCPTKESCRQCPQDSCWSSINCQKNKTSHFIKGVNQCHKLCLGGCVNSTAEGCNVCSKLNLNGKCVEECPSDLLLFRDTMRCISQQNCIKAKLIPFNGECRRQCPDTYSQYNPATKMVHRQECFKCEIKCLQRCFGAEIRGLADLEYFRGCTVVDGTLIIKLGLNMTDINEKLEETLGNIETINGALKIYRSFSLTSLSFFRNLVKINSDNATSLTRDRTLQYRNPYAIEITENDNLQTLFDWKEKLQLEIIGGGMSFHYNSKLCMGEIHRLQNMTKYDRIHDSIGYDTNGYDEICHATGIFAFHVVDSHSNVRIYWNITDFGSNRRLVGYFVYFIETSAKNITYFSGLDACSTKRFRHSVSKDDDMPMISKKSHSEIWQSIFVPFEDLTHEKGYFEMTLTNLKQYTQYAYYIRTQLSLKHQDQLLNVTQGQSQVKYFQTLPDRPRPPIVRTKEKTNVTLTLEWNPSTPEHEFVQKYFIDVYVMIDDVDEIDKRNYCRNPKENTEKKEDVVKTPEVICCRDQRAYLEFFQRDFNQTCGETDPSCELTYQFVLFHHHVEKTLLTADPSRRYQFKPMPYETPKHHEGTTDPIKRKFGADHSKYYLHSHIIDDKLPSHILVPTLKPFILYAFYVYACNHISNCSDYYFHSDRTEPYIFADNVGIVAVPDEHRTDIVTLIIEPPIEPNGVTVSYEIESFDYSRNIVNVKCITRKDMEGMNYKIRIENLLHGSHSFRVRSLSLGQDGDFSKWVIVEVDDLSYIMYNWGIGLAFIVIFIIILITVVYKKTKICRGQRIHDIDYLLPSRRDSDESSVQFSSTVSLQHASKRTQPRQSSPSSIPSSAVEEHQRPRPRVPTSERIQLTVFKSNVVKDSTLSPSTSTDPSAIPVQESTLSLNEPSTSTDPIPTMSSSAIPVQESTPHSPPEISFMKQSFRFFQNIRRNDIATRQLIGSDVENTSIDESTDESIDASISDSNVPTSSATQNGESNEIEYEFPLSRKVMYSQLYTD